MAKLGCRYTASVSLLSHKDFVTPALNFLAPAVGLQAPCLSSWHAGHLSRRLVMHGALNCYMFMSIWVPLDRFSVFFVAPLITNVPTSQVPFHLHGGVFAWLNLTESILNSSKVHQCVDIKLISPLASWVAFFFFRWNLNGYIYHREAACSAVLITHISARMLSNFHILSVCIKLLYSDWTYRLLSNKASGGKEAGKISLTEWNAKKNRQRQ